MFHFIMKSVNLEVTLNKKKTKTIPVLQIPGHIPFGEKGALEFGGYTSLYKAVKDRIALHGRGTTNSLPEIFFYM